jgi:uroporphyrin-III C-methyltransferase/precorrin-2 dehydrogenase/sirohydrochlorin ferrochelatase
MAPLRSLQTVPAPRSPPETETILPHPYPAMLLLAGRPVLVVGAGPIAARKIEALLTSGATVTVVAPEVHPEIDCWAETGAIRLLRTVVASDHLDGMWLVVSATGVPAVDRRLAAECERRRIFFNAVDRPEDCSFYVPSIVRDDPILVAISTDGQSPALAAYLRRTLGAALPPGVGRLATLLGRYRQRAREALPTAAERHRFFTGLLDSPLLEEVASGRLAAAEERIEAALAQAIAEVGGTPR